MIEVQREYRPMFCGLYDLGYRAALKSALQSAGYISKTIEEEDYEAALNELNIQFPGYIGRIYA